MSGSANCMTAARKFLTKYLCRILSNTLKEIFVILYILDCHIIYLIFKTSRSVLQVEIVFWRDLSLWQCAALYFLWNLHMQEVLYFELRITLPNSPEPEAHDTRVWQVRPKNSFLLREKSKVYLGKALKAQKRTNYKLYFNLVNILPSPYSNRFN